MMMMMMMMMKMKMKMMMIIDMFEEKKHTHPLPLPTDFRPPCPCQLAPSDAPLDPQTSVRLHLVRLPSPASGNPQTSHVAILVLSVLLVKATGDLQPLSFTVSNVHEPNNNATSSPGRRTLLQFLHRLNMQGILMGEPLPSRTAPGPFWGCAPSRATRRRVSCSPTLHSLSPPHNPTSLDFSNPATDSIACRRSSDIDERSWCLFVGYSG